MPGVPHGSLFAGAPVGDALVASRAERLGSAREKQGDDRNPRYALLDWAVESAGLMSAAGEVFAKT